MIAITKCVSSSRWRALLHPLLPVLLVLSLAGVACGQGKTAAICLFVDEEPRDPSAASAGKEPEKENEDGDRAPKIPTVRPPFAEEVGPAPSKPGRAIDSITPLPGLPLETGFDNVGWIPQGPAPGLNGDDNIPAQNNPTAGCVTAIAPHPSNQNILYIGTANGGVWRTDNALDTNPRWRPLTDDQLSLSIGGLAVDPTDASGNTLVAGFGRRSSYSNLGGAQKGLLRTTDGGATWTRLGETDLAGRSVYNLAARGSIILVAAPSTDNSSLPGLYRSTNGGANFSIVTLPGNSFPVGVSHLAADPSNLNRFYVHAPGYGVYRSDNAGASWLRVWSTSAAQVAEMALAVSGNGTVFAAELATTSNVYRSTDLGASWIPMDQVTANTDAFFNGFVADPSNSNLVYLSGLFVRTQFPFSGRVVRGDASLPAGSQWTSIASTSSQGTGTAPHTDSRVLAFTAGSRLVEGDDGGVYELPIANTGSEGTGSQWRSLNGNLQDGEMHSMIYDRASHVVVGGLQDTGSETQLLPGMTTWSYTTNGDGGEPTVDYITYPGQSIRYGSAQYFGSFLRAGFDANNNQTFGQVLSAPAVVNGGTPIVNGPNGNCPFVTPLAANAVAGGRLTISGYNNIWESSDYGISAQEIDSLGANQLARIAYGGRFNGSDNPDVFYYGWGNQIRYRTTAGGSFGTINFPGGTVQGIVFDPENWGNAYVVATNLVYTMTGGGSGFSNVTGNLTGVGTFHTIEYLTLPSGNGIVVGTDLGAYFMRLSSPGVWTTLGDNLPHAPVFVANYDPVGQMLAVSTLGRGAWLYDFKSTKATGQYGETFQAFLDGTTALPARVGELFSSQPGTATAVKDANLRELQLTEVSVPNTSSAFRIPDLDPGVAVPAFSAKWSGEVYGDPNNLADGFSFNFGPLGGISATSFTNGTYLSEDGFNAGLTVSVRTYAGNSPGYYVRVNGGVVANGFVSKPSSNWGTNNTTRHFFEVDWRFDTGLTLRVDGVAIFTNLPTPGFSPAAGNRFVFGARCGASTEEVRFDNIAIFTGGVLSPLSGTAPYYYSTQNTASGETADKAFDGDVNTKWFALDYTGFIGASFTSSKTVRLYTIATANDFPARDPFAWDFQTGDDGTLWTQHGTQNAQFFANRFERRAFVVPNPSANQKFRAVISQNDGDTYLQLSEFQPWEFIPFSAHFIVANTGDSGVSSLRQALSDSAVVNGGVITFNPNLSGQTITLANEMVTPNSSGAVTIDGSGLTNGLTIDGGGGSNRLFTVNSGASLTLTGLTLTGGNGAGAANNGDGGAIFNAGSLTLNRCTLTGNSVSGSSARIGGAILNYGTLNLTQCTLAGNSTTGNGGAIETYGYLTLNQCTVSGNTASVNGGGIDNGNGSAITLTLNNSIVAGNSAVFSGQDLNNFNGIVTKVGANIVPGYSGVAATGSGTISAANPLLAPLDFYGGPTKTMALERSSPALNAAVGSTITSDQRGFPLVGAPDIGAYEAGTPASYNAYIWETLPAGATVAQHAQAIDYDGDGMSNYNEFLAATDAADRLSLFHIIQAYRSGQDWVITIPTSNGRVYTVEHSTDLVSWTPYSGSFTGNGFQFTFGLPGAFNSSKLFVRVRTGP